MKRDDMRAKIHREITNVPEAEVFIAGVAIEAAHESERWGMDKVKVALRDTEGEV